jgi:Malectin domain
MALHLAFGLTGCALDLHGLSEVPGDASSDAAHVSSGTTNAASDAARPHDADLGEDAPIAVVDGDGGPDPAGDPPLLARLAIDGPTYVGVDYAGTWTASPVPGTCGPYAYQAAASLHGTPDAPLFVGEAYGNPMTCSVGAGLAPGTYRVRLYFAETYWGPGCPGGGGIGSRVFDIVLEGTTVLRNFDVFAASGGCLASTTSDAGVPIARTFDIPVSDGTLDISLPASADNAKLSALEVFGPL